MWLPLTAVLIAGPFQLESGDLPLRVVSKAGASECYRLAPEQTLRVIGPTVLQLVLFVDLSKRPRRPPPAELTFELDGDPRVLTIKPKGAKRTRYNPAVGPGIRPSQATKPIPMPIDDGFHRLRLRLEGGQSGCVMILGAEPGEVPEPAVAAEAEGNAGAAAADSTAGGAAGGTEAGDGAVAAATTETSGDAERETSASPTAEPTAGARTTDSGDGTDELELPPPDTGGRRRGNVVELVALPDAPPARPPSSAITAKEAPYLPPEPDIIRFGAKGGAIFPRGSLATTFAVGLTIEVPIPANIALGGAFLELSPYLEGGWCPMSSQQTVITQRRGLTSLIQNTLALPFEVGLRARFDFDVWLQPMISIAFAMDYTLTELQIFSLEPVQQERLAFGGAVALGLYLPAGPGGFLLEGRYREVQTEFAQLEEVAEPVFSAAAAQLSYIFAIPR